jgi:hypothetical protein
MFPVPYAESWDHDLNKVLQLVREAYSAFPIIVQSWESWVENAPRNPSQCPMYVPFAKELFGLDKTDFINGEQLSYFDGKCYSNKSDDRNISANTENDAKSRVNSFSGFGINDMACYETAPSMTFGRLHNNDIKSSAVPYKQIDSSGKHIYSTEKDMNIVSNNKKSQIKRKKNHETVTQNEESEDIVDEDGYIQLTTFGKHKILKYGDPLEYVNKSFKLPTKKSKKLLAVDWDLCLVLGVVKKSR